MTEGEFIVEVLHNRNGNLGYGTCSKYLGFPLQHWSIESQVKGLRIQMPVMESFH